MLPGFHFHCVQSTWRPGSALHWYNALLKSFRRTSGNWQCTGPHTGLSAVYSSKQALTPGSHAIPHSMFSFPSNVICTTSCHWTGGGKTQTRQLRWASQKVCYLWLPLRMNPEGHSAMHSSLWITNLSYSLVSVAGTLEQNSLVTQRQPSNL